MRGIECVKKTSYLHVMNKSKCLWSNNDIFINFWCLMMAICNE